MRLKLANGFDSPSEMNVVSVLVSGREVARLGRQQSRDVVFSYADGDRLEIREHFSIIRLSDVQCTNVSPAPSPNSCPGQTARLQDFSSLNAMAVGGWDLS